MYHDGIWSYTPSGNECKSLNQSKANPIHLFGNGSLFLQRLAFPILHTVVDELQEVIDFKNKEEENGRGTVL